MRTWMLSILVLASVFCGAQTWENIGPAGKSGLVVMPDPVHQDSIYGIFGALSDIRLELLRTPDAGDSWDTLGNYNGGALHPATAETIFAAFGAGSFSDGIWRSNDYGGLFDFPPPSWMFMAKGVTYDRADPSRLYGWGSDLERSTDGGATWEVVMHSTPSGTYYIGAAVDPVRNHRVYAWNDGGEMFLSTDFGATWRSLHVFPESMSPADLAVAYDDSATIYAACWGGLAKSTDCGISWVNRPMESPPSNCVWVSEASPEFVIMGGGYGLKASSDGGATWSLLGDSVACEVLDFAVGPRAAGGEYWYIGTSRLGIERMPAIPFSEGPIVSNPFPPDEAWVSLDSFDVFIGIRDPDGIDSSTVRFDVDGTVFTCADDELWMTDSGLVFRDDFDSGDTLDFQLTAVEDVLGNPSEMTPFGWTIFVDTDAPELSFRYPDSAEVVDGSHIMAKFYARDDGCGIDSSSFFVAFDSETLDLSSPAVIVMADTYLVDLPTAGISPEPSETVDVHLHLADTPTIGEPNALDAAWFFSTEPTGVEEAEKPRRATLSAYPNPFNASCSIESSADLIIYDVFGNSIRSIAVDRSGHAVWDGRSDDGNPVSSGVYWVKQVGGSSARIVLLR